MPLRSSSTASKAKKEVVVSPYFKPDRTSHGSKGFSLKSTTFQSKKELREEDELIPVPDILDYNLQVLFVGINGGITSSKRGHHFASPTNHFWPCLSASGLVDRKLTFEDDTSLPQSYGIGFTNLTSRVSRRATDLTIDEQRANVPQLTQKIRQYRPKWVAFVGMGIYQIYSGQRKVEAGLQNTTIAWQQGTGGSKVYVMPSTSGLVAAYHKKDKMKYFIELGHMVNGTHVDRSLEEANCSSKQ